MWLWKPEPVNFSANLCRKVWLTPLWETDLIFFFLMILNSLDKSRKWDPSCRQAVVCSPWNLATAQQEKTQLEQEAWTRLSRPQATWATVRFTILFYTDMNWPPKRHPVLSNVSIQIILWIFFFFIVCANSRSGERRKRVKPQISSGQPRCFGRPWIENWEALLCFSIERARWTEN